MHLNTVPGKIATRQFLYQKLPCNIFKNILKSIIFGIFKTDKGMGEGDSEGIWDAAMGEMTRWVLHMGRWISLERTSWKGDHRFGCL